MMPLESLVSIELTKQHEKISDQKNKTYLENHKNWTPCYFRYQVVKIKNE